MNCVYKLIILKFYLYVLKKCDYIIHQTLFADFLQYFKLEVI